MKSEKKHIHPKDGIQKVYIRWSVCGKAQKEYIRLKKDEDWAFYLELTKLLIKQGRNFTVKYK